MQGDAVYYDGSKLKGHPKTHHLLPKTLGHLRSRGGTPCGLWDGVTGEEDGASMLGTWYLPGSESHAGRTLLPAPAQWVGMGEAMHRWGGDDTALPTNCHLLGSRKALLSSQDISSPQEPTHGLDEDRGLIKELCEWLFSDK